MESSSRWPVPERRTVGRAIAIAIAIATVVSAALAPAGPAEAAAPAGSYVGISRGTDGGPSNVVQLSVSTDRRVSSISASGYEGRLTLHAHIRSSGRFHFAVYDGGDDGEQFDGDGRFDARGVVHGEFQSVGPVTARPVPFTARHERGLASNGPRLFDIYGGSGSRPGAPRPATGLGADARGVAQLTDGSLVIPYTVGDAGYENAMPDLAGVVGVSEDGVGSRLAGGASGNRGDGGPAARARFTQPGAVVALADGGYILVDEGAGCAREVSPDHTIRDVAGTCGPTPNGLGDGGPATAAALEYPAGVAPLPGGGFVIVDRGDDRVREVTPGGVISTIAGNGRTGFSGDGGPATVARLRAPTGVTVLPTGAILVADTGNARIREIDPGGTITTIAGGGRASVAHGIGDGGPATHAALEDPTAVVAAPGGGFVIADTGLGRIRRVGPDGTITTIAGGGPDGQGAIAADAGLDGPTALSALADGGLAFVQDGAVLAIEPDQTQRLLIALTHAPHHVRPHHAFAISLRSTLAGRATIAVAGRHGHVVARVTRPAAAGEPRLSVPGLPAGTDTLHVIDRSGGRVATTSAQVQVAPAKPDRRGMRGRASAADGG